MADTIENPYLAVVTRKNRNLKKKMQNIQKVEAQLAEGKTLNEEQLVLLSTKPSVERALLDVEAIRVQLEEVAKELASQVASQPAPVVETVVIEVSTETAPVVQVAASTQFDTVAQEPAVVLPAAQPGFDLEFVQNLLQTQVRKLLKTLHVCSRYNSITGTNLPPDVDYFGKCLLGMTSIGDFHDALSQSVKNATMFLDPEVGSQHEAIRGMNFVELSDLIDQLAGHIDGGSGGDNSMESFFSALASPPPQPEINFFGTDEIVDESAPAAAPEPSLSEAAPAAPVAPTAQADGAAPRKQKEKRERKPRPEKKKDESSAAVNADAAEQTASARAEKPVRKNDKPRAEKPKKAPAASSPNENANAAVANEKTEKPPRDSKPARSNSAPKKEKPAVAAAADADAPVAAPAKPAAPISYRAAVAPSSAPDTAPRPVSSASKSAPKPAAKAPRGDAPSGTRPPRPAGSKPAGGEKKPVNK